MTIQILPSLGIQLDCKFISFNEIQNIIILEEKKMFSFVFVLVITFEDGLIKMEANLKECQRLRNLILKELLVSSRDV